MVGGQNHSWRLRKTERIPENVVAVCRELRSCFWSGMRVATGEYPVSSIIRSFRESIEVNVIRSQDAINELAIRIENAYRRKYRRWICVGLTPGVWESAASRLIEAAESDPNIPIDPELFVAVQTRTRLSPDPWSELTQHSSLDRYMNALRRIITQLRRELRSELHRADSHLDQGMTLDQVLKAEGSSLSPLTCFILAHRAGRRDLCSYYRTGAQRQHRSCPLYKSACRSFLPNQAYPAVDHEINRANRSRDTRAFSLN